MKIEGEFTIGERVLSENPTLREVYKSVILTPPDDLLITLEEPNFLEPYHDRIRIVLQLSSSGTVDMKIIPIDPVTDAEYDEALSNVPDHLKEEWTEKFEERKKQRDEELLNSAVISIRSERGGATASVPDKNSDEVQERYRELKQQQEDRYTNSGDRGSTVVGLLSLTGKVSPAKTEGNQVSEGTETGDKK
jgi:hypothetical protein